MSWNQNVRSEEYRVSLKIDLSRANACGDTAEDIVDMALVVDEKALMVRARENRRV